MEVRLDKKVIIVAGPTCVGKSSYALGLAQKYNADIFSADSRQIYKEMNIGTAKPSKAELAAAKHHFIDHININTPYSVGDFEKELLLELNTYFREKDVAIICGGTGLYVDAILYGLDTFPEISKEIKSQVIHDLNQNGLDYLCNELLQKDPEYYDKVDLKNPRRITRAIEVMRQSGQPFSNFLTKPKVTRPFESQKIILSRDRESLYTRINQRVDQMIKMGLVEEAKSLYPFKSYQALQTVGYQELFSFFDGQYDLETAIEKIKQNTRRYAKRQLTWLRKKTDWEVIKLD